MYGLNVETIDLRGARADPAKPGKPARHDYEYERNGGANMFIMFAPLEGWRHLKVTSRDAAVDYAQALKDLSDTHFPDADMLVQDNLSTHTTASLYAAFPAASEPPRRTVWMALHAQARKLADMAIVSHWVVYRIHPPYHAGTG